MRNLAYKTLTPTIIIIIIILNSSDRQRKTHSQQVELHWGWGGQVEDQLYAHIIAWFMFKNFPTKNKIK